MDLREALQQLCFDWNDILLYPINGKQFLHGIASIDCVYVLNIFIFDFLFSNRQCNSGSVCFAEVARYSVQFQSKFKFKSITGDSLAKSADDNWVIRINWMIYRYGVCMSCHTHTHSIRYFVHSRRTKGKEIVFATKHVVVVPLLGLASYAHNCVCHTKFRKCHRHLHLTLMCYVFCVLHSFVNRYAKSLTFLLDTKRARCTPVRYHTILWCTRIWTMNVLETCHT